MFQQTDPIITQLLEKANFPISKLNLLLYNFNEWPLLSFEAEVKNFFIDSAMRSRGISPSLGSDHPAGQSFLSRLLPAPFTWAVSLGKWQQV